MRDFTLGIIGGCLTHQGGIANSQLYHRRLAKSLADREIARLRVRIARDFHLDHEGRLRGLLERRPLDAVLVHARSVFTRKAAFFVTAVNGNQYSYYLHPFLFRPWRYGWLDEENRKFSRQRALLRRTINVPAVSQAHQRFNSEVPATRVSGFAARDLFYIAGALVGLDQWAVRDELCSLRAVRELCHRIKLPMIVLGPGRRPGSYWQDRVCRKLDRRLQRELGLWSIPYCGLPELSDSRGVDLYLRDGWHFSEAGHAYVAEQLSGALRPMLRYKGQLSCA